jgi:hypothetical protein
VRAGRNTAGWAAVLLTERPDHPHFGSLRVGTIVDCLAAREFASCVVAEATRTLEDLGADLVISNQSHRIWIRAFRESGFLAGPSNYLYAASPKLAGLAALPSRWEYANINRGDGDGIVNL